MRPISRAGIFNVNQGNTRSGFTLIELALVVLIISIIMALAMPRLTPAVAFSELEGSARRMAGYGRALMAHCALVQEAVTFKMDLDNQEYWATRWKLEDDSLFFEDDGDSSMGFSGFSDSASNSTTLGSTDEEMLNRSANMRRQFELMVKVALEAQAKAVPKEGILDEIGPLFDKEFTLDIDDEDDNREEIKTDLLSRAILPRDIRVERVSVGGQESTTGIVDVELTAMGLGQTVEFTLTNGKDYYTVVWDAITGGARISKGEGNTGDASQSF